MDVDANALNDALACDDEARALYGWLAPAHRAEFEAWIRSAPSPAARRTRIGAVVDMLAGRDVLRMH